MVLFKGCLKLGKLIKISKKFVNSNEFYGKLDY